MTGTGTEDLETRRKRLAYRSRHRGTKEMDMFLGGFADCHLLGFSAPQLDRFEALLQNSDPDLYGWITGRDSVPADLDHDVMRLLRDFRLKT